MRQLLQDECVNWLNLFKEEKSCAFDDEVNLKVQQGKTVKLVSWIRFHRIYRSGLMHIRFFNHPTDPVILVLRTNERVAADVSCDIQTMHGDQNAPKVVKELLEPNISLEDSLRYEILLCDGIKWKLVGCITFNNSETSPVEKSPVAEPKSHQKTRQPTPEQPVEREFQFRAKFYFEEEHEEDATEMTPSVQHPNTIEQKRQEVEEGLVTYPPPKLSSFPSSGQSSFSSTGTCRREANPTYRNPNQCILPDD